MEAFPLVNISGSPIERGRQYGQMAKDRILLSSRIYTIQLEAVGISRTDLSDLVKKFLPIIDAFAPAYLEEMRAIAEGAEIDVDYIVLINARTEILALASRAAARSEHAGEGCTGAVVLPERSANDHLLHGQNWDWIPECAASSIILRVTPDIGPSFLTFTEAGGLARNGLNDAGIAITANYLECDRDFTQVGVPLALIRRKVLEQEYLAQALRIVAITSKSASNNMIISHRDGYAQSIECAPDEAFNIWPRDGLLVHANHWQSQVALMALKEQSAWNWADSFYRDRRVAQHLSKKNDNTLIDLKGAFADQFGSPFGVCRSPCSLSGEKLLATVATIVMCPAEGFMEVAALPYSDTEFTSYRLGEKA